MNPKTTECYMCGEIATSREHVPPKCLFPEKKDSNGVDYKRELITVPSCELHNNSKSKDDEFLMASLAGIIGNNAIGITHKFGKVNRAILKSSSKLLDAVFLKRTHFKINLKDNKFLEMIWGTPDFERLENCIQHIAYGIYYHHYGCRFNGEITSFLSYLHNKDNNFIAFKEIINNKIELELAGKESFGQNKEIFHYQFTEKDEFGLQALRLCFYGGVYIYVSFMPTDSAAKSTLIYQLINAGIQTHITLDNKTYILNKP